MREKIHKISAFYILFVVFSYLFLMLLVSASTTDFIPYKVSIGAQALLFYSGLIAVLAYLFSKSKTNEVPKPLPFSPLRIILITFYIIFAGFVVIFNDTGSSLVLPIIILVGILIFIIARRMP